MFAPVCFRLSPVESASLLFRPANRCQNLCMQSDETVVGPKADLREFAGRRTLAWCSFSSVCFLRYPVAQTQEQQGPGPGRHKSDVNLVLLDATVKTKAGKIMGDLTQESFQLREDGVHRESKYSAKMNCPSTSPWYWI